MTDEESTTVSRSLNWMYLCCFVAMRISAANSSPCAPVERMTILSGGYLAMSCAGIMVPLSILSSPARSAISILFLIERPSVTIFFPYFSALSMMLIMRSNCDANVPMIRRLETVLMISSSVCWTRFSGIENPSRSAFVESAIKKRFLSFASSPHVCTSRSEGTPSSCSSFKSPERTTLP
ncbi:MAG: hypothetical protein UY94_C0013G0008 [Parcubacteria group bacterium GW2011_GWA2_56_21]|nr:MAG: hypothetical protein UY94_C0013G0008 [Parcubacteria group bacterium GW2011_GWA2_56_21]